MTVAANVVNQEIKEFTQYIEGPSEPGGQGDWRKNPALFDWNRGKTFFFKGAWIILVAHLPTVLIIKLVFTSRSS